MKILKKLASTSLVVRILAGLVVGVILGLVIPNESLSQGNYIALLFWAVILGIALKRNPYPLILYCMKRSALTAFFTRSSAANIPVNMELCKDLGLNEEMYSVSIPLGSTINMDGAAVVITTLTLVAAHTTGVNVSLPMAIKRIKREKPRRRGASLFKRKDGYGRAVGYVSCLLGAESEGSRPQHAQQYDQNQRDDLFDIIHFQFPLIRLCGSDDPAFSFRFQVR